MPHLTIFFIVIYCQIINVEKRRSFQERTTLTLATYTTLQTRHRRPPKPSPSKPRAQSYKYPKTKTLREKGDRQIQKIDPNRNPNSDRYTNTSTNTKKIQKIDKQSQVRNKKKEKKEKKKIFEKLKPRSTNQGRDSWKAIVISRKRRFKAF